MKRASLLAAAICLLVFSTAAQATHRNYLLPASGTCAYENSYTTGIEASETSVRCLLNHVRSRLGLQYTSPVSSLISAARRKSLDLYNCGVSHQACGRDTWYWVRYYGYWKSGCTSIGEDLGYGTYGYGAPRSIVSAWLHSDTHYAVVAGRSYNQKGVGLYRTGVKSYWTLYQANKYC